jgi:predicted transcriptional regulator
MKRGGLNKVVATLVSELFPKRIVDDSAESVKEISKRVQLSERQALRSVEQLIAEGKIEKVWKHGTRNLIPAFRIKQK